MTQNDVVYHSYFFKRATPATFESIYHLLRTKMCIFGGLEKSCMAVVA